MYTLAQVLETLGEKDLAIAQYRQVLTILPTHAGTKRQLEGLTGKTP